MALTWVGICNMALGRIGITTVITDLSNTDKASVVCNDAYEACRDAVLEDFDWKCAAYRKALVQNATAPAFGFDYQYDLPSTPYCLKVREIYPVVDYKIEGRLLLTDYDNTSADLYIRYTKRITDPTDLETLCAKAIAWRIAAERCYAFVQASTLQEKIFAEYRIILDEAMRANQQQDTNNDEKQNSSIYGNAEWISAGR